MSWVLRFVLILMLAFSSPLLALRCGRSLVDLGDYKYDVVERCGDPDFVDSHYEKRGQVNRADISRYNFNNQRYFPDSSVNFGQNNYGEIEILVEEWFYDFGNERFRKILRFENGRLVNIKNAGKRR